MNAHEFRYRRSLTYKFNTINITGKNKRKRKFNNLMKNRNRKKIIHIYLQNEYILTERSVCIH